MSVRSTTGETVDIAVHTTGGGHCCLCAGFCWHVGGPWLCEQHRAQERDLTTRPLRHFPPTPRLCRPDDPTGHDFQPKPDSTFIFCRSCGKTIDTSKETR